MKRKLQNVLVMAIGLAALATYAAPGQEIREMDPQPVRQPLIQLAILLDNSGSMSGLIDQARSELWRVVNELVSAKQDGMRPRLEVALYTYGDPPPQRRVELTEDLDKVSEELFKVQIHGGSEYCGQVIQQAVRELKWSKSADDLKLIFIAGNEPFSQGPVDYREACREAIARGIMVNTIHCGQGIPSDWNDGAVLADGRSMSIDHNTQVVHVEAPQDKPIAELGVALNKTYIPFGTAGAVGAARQEVQDSNASNSSLNSASQRAVAKASANYTNAAWDLCDACVEGKVDIAKVPVELLPEFMRKMTVKERQAHVDAQLAKRKELRAQIKKLDEQRKVYVAGQLKTRAQEDPETFDKVLIQAARQQATKKNFAFE